jgi:hypothetical protein
VLFANRLRHGHGAPERQEDARKENEVHFLSYLLFVHLPVFFLSWVFPLSLPRKSGNLAFVRRCKRLQ